MGCDIHMVLERKIGEGGWIGVHNFPYWNQRKSEGRHTAWPLATERNYNRFAALAGVRGEGPDPRGVPEDVSILSQVEIDHWGGDGHSHSWLTLEEAAPLFLETDYEEPDEWGRKYPELHYFGVEPDDVKDHRIVFWFDN